MKTVPSTDGTLIALERAGTGAPLVVVGGALSDRASARGLARRLAGRATVVTYDRRGRGSSGSGPHSLEREIDDLAAVVGAAGAPAYVFGHSSGAILALESALRGVPMAGLALFEPPYLVGAAAGRVPADLGRRLDELVEHGRRGEAVALFLTEAAATSPEELAALRAGPSFAAMERLAHTLSCDLVVCGGDCALDAARLGRLEVPTLVIAGGASPEWAKEAVRAVAAAIPGARKTTIPGQGHQVASAALAPVLGALLLPPGS